MSVALYPLIVSRVAKTNLSEADEPVLHASAVMLERAFVLNENGPRNPQSGRTFRCHSSNERLPPAPLLFCWQFNRRSRKPRPSQLETMVESMVIPSPITALRKAEAASPARRCQMEKSSAPFSSRRTRGAIRRTREQPPGTSMASSRSSRISLTSTPSWPITRRATCM